MAKGFLAYTGEFLFLSNITAWLINRTMVRAFDSPFAFIVFSGLMGGVIGLFIFHHYRGKRMKLFVHAVKVEELSPKKAFKKYWGWGQNFRSILRPAPCSIIYGFIIFLAWQVRLFD